MNDFRKARDSMREMAIDRRTADDRRDVPRGGRRCEDVTLSARDVLAMAAREEFIALDVLARALKTSRKTLLRDWEGRRYPMTTLGRRILLASTFVVRAYFPHTIPDETDHSSHNRPNGPTLP
jgi:hypothetical protein